MGRIGVASLCAALVLAGLESAASGASPAPTGSTTTIAFYRTVAAATQRTAGLEETQTGYSFMEDLLGKSSTFNVRLAAGAVPAGYVRAVEHITTANKGGRVQWISDDLVPVACSRAAVGSCLPVELLLTSTGTVWRFDSAALPASASCWGSVTHGVVDGYTKTGNASGYGLYGHFDPMRRVGGTDFVTSIYPWGKTQQATEVDTIPVTTHLPTVGVVRVSASPGNPSFTYRWTNQWLTTAPQVPHVTLCT